jgi:hypothetical protein
MLCLSYHLLCFLFNKIGGEGRTGSVWKGGCREGGVGRRVEDGQTMYAHMNKWTIKKQIKKLSIYQKIMLSSVYITIKTPVCHI